MSTQTIFLTAGATSKTVDVALVQKAAATSPGDPITGLAYNTSSFTCYQRSGALTTPTAVTLATLATVGTAWSSGGFIEIDATHMPGSYRFDIPNALLSAAGETNIVFTGAANLATHTLKIIVTQLDLYNVAANFRFQMTEGYVAPGTAPTPEQAMMFHFQERRNWNYSGASKIIYKLDGSTTANVVTLGGSPSNSGAVTT